MHPVLNYILGLLTLFIVLVSIRYKIQLYQNKILQDNKTNDSKAIMAKGFEIGYLGEKKKLEQKPVEQKPVEQKPVEQKKVEQKPVEQKKVEQKPVEPVIEEKKYIKGNDNWKYTKDDNDIDCLINWNYYDSDKKTIIQKSIPRVTTLDRNNKWCATKNNTLPTDRQIQQCGFDGPIKIKNKCLDIPNGNYENGNKLQVWDCNNTLAQNFYYNPTDETVRSISNYEKCLDIENGKTDPGTLVQIYNCNNTEAQKFLYDEKTKEFKLKKDETKCLDLMHGSDNNGNKIQVYHCNNTEAQKFEMKRNRLSDAGLTCDSKAIIAKGF